MIKNEDGTYTYLTVPSKYNCVYEKLLIKMSDLGVDLIKDCSSTCKGINRQVINCWNMFNAACSAYVLGQEKQADLLINYINDSLMLGCDKYTTEDLPKLNTFALNVPTTVVGSQKVTFDTATFNITNSEYAIPMSLNIIRAEGSKETIVASGLFITSPSKFATIELEVKEGQSYTFRASITSINGRTCYSSNDYIIKCVAAPKANTMYYGHTDIEPQVFDKMAIDELFLLEKNSKVISGSSNNTFTINQLKHIHFLLIPDSLIALVRAEYGTALVTTLWDGTDGAYVTVNPGGIINGINYKVFFLYSPQVFSEDVRITCKNK